MIGFDKKPDKQAKSEKLSKMATVNGDVGQPDKSEKSGVIKGIKEIVRDSLKEKAASETTVISGAKHVSTNIAGDVSTQATAKADKSDRKEIAEGATDISVVNMDSVVSGRKRFIWIRARMRLGGSCFKRQLECMNAQALVPRWGPICFCRSLV